MTSQTVAGAPPPRAATRGPASRAAAVGLCLAAAATVATGVFAAAESSREVPTLGLVAAWGCLFMLLLSGLLAGRALSRTGAFPGWALGVVLTASVAAQLPLVAAPAALSDDLWRYLHDGRIVLAGQNPYRHPPASPALDAFAGPERARVNHPDVRTVYPPLAQAGFAVARMVGGGPAGLKALLCACGLALALLVAALLGPADRWRVVAVAWHPLLILEVAGSGHVDVVAVLLMVLALWALRRRPCPVSAHELRRLLAAGLLVAGAWVKLLPAVVALPLGRRLGPALTVLTLVAGLAALLPPLLTEVPEDEQQGLLAYAEHWELNGLVYPWLREGIERIGLKEALGALTARVAPALSSWTGPQYTTRALLALGFLACLALGWRRGDVDEGPPVTPAFFACAGFIVFTPTLHPWYLTWVVPFLALRPSAPWLLLSGTVGLSYASALAAGPEAWVELAWPRWLSQGPFWAWLAVEAARGLRDRLRRRSDRDGS